MRRPLKTRQAYLTEALRLLRPMFRRQGVTIPRTAKVRLGNPSKNDPCDGVTWEGFPYILIDRKRRHLQALSTLVHEALHISLPAGTLHGPVFAKYAASLGLTPPWPISGVSGPLRRRLAALARDLGPYPPA